MAKQATIKRRMHYKRIIDRLTKCSDTLRTLIADDAAFRGAMARSKANCGRAAKKSMAIQLSLLNDYSRLLTEAFVADVKQAGMIPS